MIKRRFYKQEHGDGDDVSDSSLSSSSSDSDSEAEEAQEERDHSGDELEEEEEVAQEAAAAVEAKEEARECSPSPGSGYESEDSSGTELRCDPSGLVINDDEEGSDHWRRSLNNLQLPGKGKVGKGEDSLSNILAKDSVQSKLSDFVLKCKSVFKCRLCPRIVCLTEESLISHLESKRHARSEKLFGEGRLKLMLNSDGEIEEDQETHAERHARTIALAEEPTKKKKRSKGRQRQRLRSKRKNIGNGNDEGKVRHSMKSPSKKRRRNEE